MTAKLIDHGALDRHEPTVRKGDPVLIDAIGNHLTRFGDASVIHDRDSRWVHLDLFVYPATESRRFTLISTCGMAERPLTNIKGERIWTELVAILPDDWPVTELSDPKVAWPFTLLRWLARMPHQTGTGFAARESMGPIPYTANQTPPYPYDGALFLDQKLVPPLAMVGREIRFLAMCPIFAEELAWIRREGAQVLIDAFEHETDALMIDDDRPCYAP